MIFSSFYCSDVKVQDFKARNVNIRVFCYSALAESIGALQAIVLRNSYSPYAGNPMKVDMAPSSRRTNGELQEILATMRKEMPILSKQFRLDSICVFGPYARGTSRPRSTLNLVVEYEVSPSLVEMAQLKEHLQSLLGMKVDLGVKGDLRPDVKDRVLRELVRV